jgi:hypothetical protein
MTMLLDELKKGPAVLRLSYLADVEDADLVQRRLNVVKDDIERAWKELDCCYRLTIEPQVFWRLGAPPKQATARTPNGRWAE